MKIVKENINFERNQTPFDAMDIGQNRFKKKLIGMLYRPVYQQEERKKYEQVIKVIKDIETKIVFEDNRIMITLKNSPLNIFFFDILFSCFDEEYDFECYPWDNPDENTLSIWIN